MRWPCGPAWRSAPRSGTLIPAAQRDRERSVPEDHAMDAPMPQDHAPLLLRRQADGIAWLAMNRPAARNALSLGLMAELEAALAEAAADEAVKVVVIAGNGPAFCAGHDLRELRASGDRAALERVFAACAALMTRIIRLPKPVIARVHGVATAAGCQTGGQLRPRGGRRHRPLRHPRREYRPVLLHADGGADPRGRPQGGDGDAADRRADRRRPGARTRPYQPRGGGSRARCRGAGAGRADRGEKPADPGDRQGGCSTPRPNCRSTTPIASPPRR